MLIVVVDGWRGTSTWIAGRIEYPRRIEYFGGGEVEEVEQQEEEKEGEGEFHCYQLFPFLLSSSNLLDWIDWILVVIRDSVLKNQVEYPIYYPINPNRTQESY